MDFSLTNDAFASMSFFLDHSDESTSAITFRNLIDACKKQDLETITLNATTDNVNLKDKNGNTPLHIVVSLDPTPIQTQILSLLLTLNADPLTPNVVGRTALQLACIHNNLPLLKILANIDNISHLDAGGNSLMHFACLSDSDASEMVQFLLSLDCDASAKNNSDMIPLHNAVYTNQYETVKLLANRENVNISDSHGNSGLHLSIFSRHPDSYKIAKHLLSLGADPFEVNNQGRAPLYFAAQTNQLENVKVLATPENVNIQDSRGKTVLHHLFNNPIPSQDPTPIVKHLLSIGSDVMIKDNNNQRPLHAACTSNNYDSIRLLTREEIIDEPSAHGNRPLHLCCLFDANAGDAMKVVRFLMAQGANPFLLNDDDKLPLHFACLSNQFSIVKLLMSPENIDPLCKYGNSPLHYAVSSDHDTNKALRLLINNGANPTLKNKFGMSALDIAAHRANLQHFMALAGPLNINTQDENYNSPLHYALGSSNDCSDLIKYALSVGADVLISNRSGLTPLHMACYSCNVEYVKLLVNKHNVNYAGLNGNAPLMCAIIGGMTKDACETIKHILSLDGNPLQFNKCGETPIHYACYKSKLPYIKLLLDEDTINAQDKDGFTPLHYSYIAAESEASQVAEYLVANGAKPPPMNSLDVEMFRTEIPPRLYGDTFNPTKYAATQRLHDEEALDSIHTNFGGFSTDDNHIPDLNPASIEEDEADVGEQSDTPQNLLNSETDSTLSSNDRGPLNQPLESIPAGQIASIDNLSGLEGSDSGSFTSMASSNSSAPIPSTSAQ